MFGYYVEVARRLSPGELARVAARRAYRVARRTLHGNVAGPGEAKLLAAFGARSLEALPERALDGRAGRLWPEIGRRESVLEALAAVPGAERRVLERADAAARRSFVLFGREVRFGEAGAIDWCLDPASGHRFQLRPARELHLAGADPKYPWALGRLDQLISLGQGYWVAREPARRAVYAEQCASQLMDFIRRNPVGVGIQWACPMEVALRAANIAQALVLFADAAPARDPALVLAALSSLAQHGEFVEVHLEDAWAVPNNHLVADHVGLLVVGALFPRLPGAARRLAMAVRELRRQMELQVHPDGYSFEGSVPYHRLSLELFSLAYVTAVAHGISLGASFTQRLRRMFRVAQAYCSSGGLAPQIGDNDSGRALPLRDRPSLDHGYLAPLGAALLGCSELKEEGAVFPDEAAWLLGAEGLARFERLEARASPGGFGSRAGGLHILRVGGAMVAVSAGPRGQRGLGGHSHNDRLSFELHLGGRPVIVDPGTGSYHGDPALRNTLRATAAHNTIQLDRVEQSPLDPSRLFALLEGAACEVVASQAGSTLQRLVTRCREYGAAPVPVEVERTFVLDGLERALCVVDALRGEETHALALRLHLPDREARLRAVGGGELARALRVPHAPRALGPIAVELGEGGGAARAVVLFDESLALGLEPSLYSPGYGEVHEACAVTATVERGLPARIGFVVLFT